MTLKNFSNYGRPSIKNLKVAAYSGFLLKAYQVFFTLTKLLLVSQFQGLGLHQAALFETRYRPSRHLLTP